MSPSYVKRLPGAIAPETSPTSQTYRARLQRALVSPAGQIVPLHSIILVTGSRQLGGLRLHAADGIHVNIRLEAHKLRSASPADNEFCFQLHKAAMGGYVTTIWGWDEQVQRGFHARAFNPGRWQIITAGGVDIGMIDVDYRPAEIYLARIEVHPSYQGHGIGTRLVSALIDEAARKGQDLVLDVLTINHRAQALYQRLGLTEVARHGDGNIKITMRSSQPHLRDAPSR